MDNQKYHPQLAQYREIVLYDLDTGGGFHLREARAAVAVIEDNSDVFTASLRKLDSAVIGDCVDGTELLPDTFVDDDQQPLQSWWWHLGKIRNNTYPAELLPLQLRSVYTKT
jgi:hypothetical protein